MIVVFCCSLLVFSANADFKIPTYQHYTLANGLTVYLMPQSEVPLIDVQLVVRAGAINDHKLHGLANLTGEAIAFGAGKLSKQALEEQFEFLGANYRSVTGKETSTMMLSFAAKDQAELLPLFAQMLLSPSFEQAEFTKFKKRYISDLEQQKESPRRIINDAFNRSYFSNHPYGYSIEGNSKSVDQINIDDVKIFYKNFYTPANSALIIVGDFKANKMQQQVAQLFSRWSGKTKSVTLPKFDQSLAHSQVLLIDKPDATETTFMIGGKGISAKNSDAIALSVINTILGGRFTSWLNDELRVNTGLTYGARSRFDKFANGGTFYISTFTKNSTTFAAIDLALKTYQRLWNTGIDQTTLASAKAYVKGQFPPRYETSSQLANLLAKMWSLGLDDTFINDFEKNVDSLTMVKANQLAKKYFPQNNFQFVLIGKATLLRDSAKKYGKVTEQNIKNI